MKKTDIAGRPSCPERQAEVDVRGRLGAAADLCEWLGKSDVVGEWQMDIQRARREILARAAIRSPR